jgi:hypothetical protein
MQNNGGIYPVEVSKTASPEEGELARLDPEAFRKFLYRYGRVEVI